MVTPTPSRRSIRAALSAALAIDAHATFNASRCLAGFPVDPPARYAAALVTSLIAGAPTGPGREGQRPSNDLAWRLAESTRIAGLRPAPRTRVYRGPPLPAALRALTLPEIRLITALEIAFEAVHQQDNRVRLSERATTDPGAFVLKPRAMCFDFHSNGGRPLVGLSIETPAISFQVTFAEDHDLDAPPPSRLAYRVILDAPAIVEVGRLLAGDADAEHRIMPNRLPVPMGQLPAPQPLTQRQINTAIMAADMKATAPLPDFTPAAAPPGIANPFEEPPRRPRGRPILQTIDGVAYRVYRDGTREPF
jgi:hypothetical protein